MPDPSMATPHRHWGCSGNPSQVPHGEGAGSKPGDFEGKASLHRVSSRDHDAISGERGRHRGVHLDLNAGQREEKQTEHQSKPAAAASLPSCPGVSLTQTTLPWQASGRAAATASAPPAYCPAQPVKFLLLELSGCCIALRDGLLRWKPPGLRVLRTRIGCTFETKATGADHACHLEGSSQWLDVTELMSFVMDPDSRHAVGEWKARCVEPGRDVICDRGSTSPFISLDIQDMPTLGEALASWREQHYRHALSRPPTLPAIQLGRFRHNGRRTLKVRTPCDIPLVLELPVFQDDQLGCDSRSYRLSGGIVHVGDLATSGHYRPFCVHNSVHSSGSEVASPNDATTMFGPYTLYDDDKPPSTRNPSTDNLLRHNTYVVFYLCTRRAGRSNSEPGL